jgi:hypothetical protein
MSRDNNNAADQIKQKQLDDALKGFMKSALGHKPKQTTWMSYNKASR